MNRRNFLKTTGALAPAIWTGRYARAQSPNDRLNVLSIGVGNRGSVDALAAAKLGRLIAVCDVDSAKSGVFLQKLAKVQDAKPDLYKDYRKALEHKGIDVVTIGTPDHWHTAILIAAVRAGKDVYCEKPLTLTIDEGKKICKVVKETGRVVQVGTQQRTEMKQMFLQASVLARSGRLGKKLTAVCTIGPGRAGGPFPVVDPPETLDWDMWLGQAPKMPFSTERCHSTFRQWFDYSGGKLTDWGAHHVDIAHWALGVENTGPVEIEGAGEFPLGRELMLSMLQGKKDRESIPNCYQTAVTFEIALTFANGNKIILKDKPGNGIRLEGEKDQIFVSRSEITGPLIESIKASQQETAWLSEEVVKLYKGKRPTTHMENFFSAVRDRSTPISDVFTHHRSVSSCHLCNIAMLLGRKLKWDPEAQDFIGDSEATALLSRKQRKPYVIGA